MVFDIINSYLLFQDFILSLIIMAQFGKRIGC